MIEKIQERVHRYVRRDQESSSDVLLEKAAQVSLSLFVIQWRPFIARFIVANIL